MDYSSDEESEPEEKRSTSRLVQKSLSRSRSRTRQEDNIIRDEKKSSLSRRSSPSRNKEPAPELRSPSSPSSNVIRERLPNIGTPDSDGDAAMEDNRGSLDRKRSSRGRSVSKDKVYPLPPSPKGKPEPWLEKRVQKFLELKRDGKHLNESILKKRDFSNPFVLDKITNLLGIDPYATNFEPEFYDPQLYLGIASGGGRNKGGGDKKAGAGGSSRGVVDDCAEDNIPEPVTGSKDGIAYQ